MKILVLSLARSGHHGVVHWICCQSSKPVALLNNCYLGWEDFNLIPNGKTLIYNKDNRYGVIRTKDKNKISKIKTSVKNIIYNIEEFDLDDFKRYQFKKFEIDLVILILRDAYNWLASLLKGMIDFGSQEETNCLLSPWKGQRTEMEEPKITLWKKQAEEFLNNHTYIDFENFVCISFNEWFRSIDYRKQIAKKLNLTFTDEGINQILPFGDGSSFSHMHYQDNAQKMSVLSRYKNFLNFPFYTNLIEDKELIEYNKKIFDLNYPLK